MTIRAHIKRQVAILAALLLGPYVTYLALRFSMLEWPEAFARPPAKYVVLVGPAILLACLAAFFYLLQKLVCPRCKGDASSIAFQLLLPGSHASFRCPKCHASVDEPMC